MSDKDVAVSNYVPSTRRQTDFPPIDEDPHFSRVVRYMRPSDYAYGAAFTAGTPIALLTWEAFSPSMVSIKAYGPLLRLSGAIGLSAGFLFAYQRSAFRFLGLTENSREIERDMREMVDKVKKGQPLYGVSQLNPDHQGMAARNSKHHPLFIGLIPWFNFVNHPHHGVDTAKYYQQAEKELSEEN